MNNPDIAFNVEVEKQKKEGLDRVNKILTEFLKITDDFIIKNSITSNEMLIIVNTIIHRETTNNFNKFAENRARQTIFSKQNVIKNIKNAKESKILNVSDIKNYDNIS